MCSMQALFFGSELTGAPGRPVIAYEPVSRVYHYVSLTVSRFLWMTSSASRSLY
jgi:hypothetical protein